MRKKSRAIILMAILIFSFCLPLLALFNPKFEGISSLKPGHPPFFPPKFNENSISKWKETVQSADHNNNGINDQFEQKLCSISCFSVLDEEDPYGKEVLTTQEVVEGFYGKVKKPVEKLSPDHIPIVIYFPDGDYEPVLKLFEELDGNIKYKYKHAINGFAGAINHEGLKQFCDILTGNDVPFMLEEDSIFEANLYYASRNMNLRPYVWNNLSYTGDDQGSIAVLDTGIDDSHNFFTPGYLNASFSHKIVGWRDEVNGLTSPYDDHGHGSHCSGIAAGEGTPVLDGDGRTVSTYGLGLDYTGYIVFEQTINITAARFNVTDPGIVEVQCEFTDFTPGSDAVHVYIYLYQDETIVDSYVTSASSWTHTLSYTATAITLGDHSLRIKTVYDDNTGNGYVSDPHIRFRGEIHWPFNPLLFGSGNPWKGVAPDTHLVGVKVMGSDGRGSVSDIIDGINWVITNRTIYNITTMSMSFGASPGQTSIINAANNAVNNGIVTVVSAGNSGAPGNNIGSPGNADNVLTVAAMSNADEVTDYSSSGGTSSTGNTIKPDIMAPGGSYYNFSMFSADNNDNDAKGEFPVDAFLNDLWSTVGTSMSTPAVAGAANLLIEAMGGHPNWNYTATEAKRVKALLLMTATETYPLTREVDTSFSPFLNRGGKDIHEGYGRLNIDAALEAASQGLTTNSTQSEVLTSSIVNPFEKHALGSYVDLIGGEDYFFTLEVPSGADFDLHLYSNQPTSHGDPIIIASSTSPVLGVDELFSYTPPSSGRYYLIAKAISGEGFAKMQYKINEFAPILSDGSINPPAGNISTSFNFSVTYTDQDDNSPAFINVLINGTSYPMEKSNFSDVNHTDGCLYQSLLYLQPGTYNYQFECSDGIYYNSTSIITGVTVIGSNSFQPVLSNGTVTPSSGSDQLTLFTFSVNYTDPDNNAPDSINITINSTTYNMNQQDILDTNYMDGCIFIYSTTLDTGNYIFHFNCSDGVFQSSHGPFVGPVVMKSIKVAILESVGTTLTGLWDELNTNWDKYGLRKVIINYTSLAKSDITYTDLVNSQADVIVLPNAWGTYDYTPNEVTAIIKYVQAGKGIVASSSTFYIAPNNLQLAPIFGMSSSISTTIDTQFNQLDIDPLSTGIGSTLLFYNLSSPLESYTGYTLSGWTLNVSDPGILAAAYVGAPVFNFSSIFTGAAVIAHENGMTGQGRAIYCTHLDISNYGGPWTRNETQLYYNSLLYASGINISNTPPTLSSGSVTPLTGDQITQFNFSVVYTDFDNSIPLYINVLINGTPHSMVKQTPLDTNFTDGCVYQYITYLQPGTYNFSFECADWKAYNSTNVFTGLNVTKTNTNSPLLSNGQVNPSKGYHNCTAFTFSVNYSDADNNAPINVTVTINSTLYSMNKQNPLDDYYVDGCIFTFSTILDLGSYSFYFNCSDGGPTASLGPNFGPIVKLSPQWNQTRLDGIHIGFVIAHGEFNPRNRYNFLIGKLIQRGATISDITSTITPSLLANYNIIWFDESGSAMLTSEIDAIEQWVEDGGAFVVTGDTVGSAIDLAQRFGITYTGPGGTGNTTAIYPHPITTGVNEIYFPSPMASLDISSQPNATLCIESSNFDLVVAMEPGVGKFVIIADDDVFIQHTQVDNHLLFSNAFGWLGYTPNEQAPSLNDTQVNPPTGNQSTQFEFTVEYTDSDNNPPTFVNLLINGTPFSMTKQNPSDINHIDGCIYQYMTFLLPSNYQYWFECNDSLHYNSTSSNILLVNNTNIVQPELLTPQVSPNTGENSTLFNFTVWYLDADNNLPSFINITINSTTYPMLPFNPLDDNVMDGTLYYFITMLDFGFYQFQISCSDGLFFNSTEWIKAPKVDPFLGGIPLTLINPTLGSVHLSGLIDFTWSNFGAPFGPYNYTLQISNTTIFSHIFNEVENIIETLSTTSTSVLVDNPSGQYYWRVRPTYGPFDGNWSSYSNFTLIRNNYFPNLINISVSPAQGDQFTQFNFTTVYLDQDDNAPTYVNVSIDGTPYPMTKVNPLDTYYADGCEYSYNIVLSPGNHTYLFECSDGAYANSTGVFSLLVIESNNFTPSLVNPIVSPTIGQNTTTYNFYVWYYDADNNAPAYVNITINNSTYDMLCTNPLDTNYMDGTQFYFSTLLDYGIYQFKIEGFDGAFINSTGWISGPEVNPFYGLIVINEVCILTDFIEMYSTGLDKIMTGWTIQIYSNDLLTNNYTFPAGWVFRSNSVVVLREDSGSDSDTILYTGWNIPWGFNMAVGLFDYTGAHVDWFQVSAFSGSKPGDVEWVQDLSLDFNGSFVYACRMNDEDTNNASDWILRTSGSEGSLNPGQTGNGSSPIMPSLLYPLTGSVIDSSLIDFAWETLNLPVGSLNYTLQISDRPNFSNIIYEVRNIEDSPNTTSISISLSHSSGTYYWRVRPTYGPFNGTWSDYSTFIYASPPPPREIFKQLLPWILIIGLSIAAVSTITKIRRRRKPSRSTGAIVSEEPDTIPASLLEIREKVPRYLKIDPELFQCPKCQTDYHVHKLNVLHQYQCLICEVPLKRILICPHCNKMIAFKQEDFFKYLKEDLECPRCMTQPEEKILQIEEKLTETDIESAIRRLSINLISNLKEIRSASAKNMKNYMNKQSIPSLIGILLYEQEAHFRAIAAIALGMIGAKVVVPVLKHLLNKEKDILVRKYLLQSIAWLEKNG